MSGRKSDPIWYFFEKLPSKSATGCRANYSVTSVPNKTSINFVARCRISTTVHHIIDVLFCQTIT